MAVNYLICTDVSMQRIQTSRAYLLTAIFVLCIVEYVGNLQAEFMEHDEKHLPIDIRLLGALAEKVNSMFQYEVIAHVCLKRNK